MSESDVFPDLVYPARSVYHSVYGSHDGGYDPHNLRWEYWVICKGGPKDRDGWPRPIPKRGLTTIIEARERGLTPCKGLCSRFLEKLLRVEGSDQ